MTFESLQRNESFVAEVTEPSLFLARSIGEASAFVEKAPDLEDVLRGIDFQTHLVVAAFRGQTPAGGYGISVTRVHVDIGRVRVVVRLSKPLGNAPDVIAYPYDVVSVAKPAEALPPDWVMVTTDGDVLAEARR